HFAQMDAAGDLSSLFRGAAWVSPAARALVEQEEGWALGAGETLHETGQFAFIAPPERCAVAVVGDDRPRRSAQGKTTRPGYENRNGQVVNLAGTDHGQYVYLLRCSLCRHEYGA